MHAWFILVLRSTFELLQEPVRFVHISSTGTGTGRQWFDRFLIVNKRQKSICSSYKVVESLHKIWSKPLNSY